MYSLSANGLWDIELHTSACLSAVVAFQPPSIFRRNLAGDGDGEAKAVAICGVGA